MDYCSDWDNELSVNIRDVLARPASPDIFNYFTSIDVDQPSRTVPTVVIEEPLEPASEAVQSNAFLSSVDGCRGNSHIVDYQQQGHAPGLQLENGVIIPVPMKEARQTILRKKQKQVSLIDAFSSSK